MSSSAHVAYTAESVPPGSPTFISNVELKLRRFVEVLASIILVIEIGVLFTGVVARYVLHAPVTWSDEVASILFIWLAMLGAASAFQRNQHMKMTALSARAGPRAARVLEVLSLAVPLAFLLLIVHPATEYALDERMVVTPALEISNAWRAFAFPVGVMLMIAFAFFRILRTRLWSPIIVAAAIFIAAAACLYIFGKPHFAQLSR